MNTSRSSKTRIFGGTKKKSFSSKGKIEKYNQDGTETIIVMGRPFRVVQKISEEVEQTLTFKRGSRKNCEEPRSYVFLVENTEHLPEFPRRFALKRSFFNVNEMLLAHREPDIFGRVKDKNIVHVFHSEVTRSDGKIGVTVAMEYCRSNLNSLIQRDMQFTEGEIVQVLLAITSAVGCLHSQQPPIAHRNICPECILIDVKFSDATAYRLCGFGGSSTEAYECATREEVVMAIEDIERHTKPAFRAPEMANPGSGKRIDERVDLWAIGVLLYYMMYFQLPFGESILGLTGRHELRFPAGSESRYTGSLRVALTHLLEPDPDKRWDIFALTNFLRFDEDISRHIGTFFFTATEWPEGWERQAVKVLNRAAPPRAPPLRVNTNERVASANGDVRRQSVTGTGKNTERSVLDELDPRALAALGISPGDTKDPEMSAHCEKLIREQEEVLQKANSAMKAHKQDGDDGTTAKAEQKQERKKENEQQFKDDAAQQCKTNDIFDDLFDTTPAPSHPPIKAAPLSTTAQPAASATATFSGDHWKDSLFSGVSSLQQTQTQAQMQDSFAAIMMDDCWQSGAPTTAPITLAAGCGVADPALQWPQATASPQIFIPPPPTQQSGSFPSWNAGVTFPSQAISSELPQGQQQQPFVQQPAPEFIQRDLLSSAPAQSKKEEKKDPFEELFNASKQV